jgi:hypothetical protein
MSDETTATSGTATEGQTTQAAATETAKTFTQEDVNRLIAKELKPFKEIKSNYEKILEEQQKQKDAELSESERLKKRVAELEPYEQSAKEYETELTDIVSARVASIPEDKKSLVPEGFSPAKLLKWLDANQKILFGTERPVSSPDSGTPAKGAPDTLRLKAEEKVKQLYPRAPVGDDVWKGRVERMIQSMKDFGLSA